MSALVTVCAVLLAVVSAVLMLAKAAQVTRYRTLGAALLDLAEFAAYGAAFCAFTLAACYFASVAFGV